MDAKAFGLVGAGGLAVSAGALWGFGRSSTEKLADVVFSPHDRDGSGDVNLDGPPRLDDERLFDHPSKKFAHSSFITLLQAADLLGNSDQIATRDEVIGLMRLADENGNGRLSRGEQKKLTHAARYSENFGGFTQDKVTIREAADAITRHKSSSANFDGSTRDGEEVLAAYGASRRD